MLNYGQELNLGQNSIHGDFLSMCTRLSNQVLPVFYDGKALCIVVSFSFASNDKRCSELSQEFPLQEAPGIKIMK